MTDNLVTTILDQGARHAVIEASAGTGKTYTLEHLYLGIIERGLDPASILVMTFTDKATRELRERIHTRLLENESQQASETARRRYRVSIEQFDVAPIRTLNAFCLGVLREYAFALGRPMEETIVREHFVAEVALRTLLRTELRTDNEHARTLAQALNRYGESKLARALYDLHVATHDGAEVLPKVHGSWRETALRELAAAMPSVTDQALAAQVQTALSDREQQHTYARVAEKFLRSNDANGEVGERLRDALLDASDAIESPLAVLLARLLPRFSELFEAHLTQTESLTHASVQRDTLALLRTHEHALSDLRARFRFALVDEFQDVDTTQWALLSLLFVEPTETPDSTIDPALRFARRFFAIGDPKQAIYGFRGADVQLYWDVSRALEERGDASAYALTRNFRSRPRLLRAVNTVVENEFFHGPNRYAAPSVAARIESDSASVPVVVYQIAGTKEILFDTARPVLLDEYVREIQQLRAAGNPLARILVLARSSTECAAVAQALRAANIECVWKSDRSLWASREARALASLLAALLDPTPGRIRACLIEPFLSLPLSAVVDYNSEETLRAKATFEHWLELARSRKFASVLHELLGRVRGKPSAGNYAKVTRKLLAWHVCEQLDLAQMELRLRLAIDGFEEGQVSIASDNTIDAVRVMTIHGAKGLEADYVFLYGGYNENFTHVADVARFTSNGVRTAYLGKPGLRMRSAFRQQQQQEEERLYYVALTRAKERVYLTHWGAPPSSLGSSDLIYDLKYPISGGYRTVNTRLELLMGASDDFEVRMLTVQTTASSSGPQGAGTSARLSSIDDELGGSRTTLAPATAVVRMSADYTSYSRMKALVRSDTRFFAENKPNSADDETHQRATTELPTGAEYGVFLHSLLEHAPWHLLCALDESAFVALGQSQADPTQRHFYDRVQNAAFLANIRDASVVERSLAMVFRTLSAELICGELELAGGLRTLPSVERETPFLHPLPNRAYASRDAFVRGILDMTFLYDGKLFILDWKSDALPNYDEPTLRAHVVAEYQAQARLYAIAGTLIAASHTERAVSFGGVLYTFVRAHETAEGVPSATLYLPADTAAIANDWSALSEESAFGYPLPRYATNGQENAS